MTLAFWEPVRDILQATSRDIGNRAKAGIAKAILAIVAAGLLLSAGLVALAQAVGYPIAALVFAAVFALLALVAHLIGRVLARRQAQRIAHAKSRAEADLALATSVARSTLPLLPLVAFVAAFALGRRT
ncbi:hypothetical protein [Aquicoccus porphyridii]|uniref:hypothetical protein n=1 Tax=Aquicoccus porphyridii TaxID=1852029 RepID=UPI00273EDFB0|nr:hypothetical protein [Aquicoccus porphyridii]